jgi:hypothetical protein
MEVAIELMEQMGAHANLAMMRKYEGHRASALVSPNDWLNFDLTRPLPGGCEVGDCKSPDVYWNRASERYQCCACSTYHSAPAKEAAPTPLVNPKDDDLFA